MKTIKSKMMNKVTENETITEVQALGYTIDFLQGLPFVNSLEALTKAVAFYLIHSKDSEERKKEVANKLAVLTDVMMRANRNVREITMVANSFTDEEINEMMFRD